MLLFGVHPIHVESVAWITERKDVLYSFFLFLALWHWGKYLQGPEDDRELPSGRRSNSYWYALVFFVLSLLSKGQAVVVPVLLLLLDYYKGRGMTAARPWLEKIPFVVLSLIIGFLALHFQNMDSVNKAISARDIATKGYLSSYALMHYVAHTLFPYGLSAAYPVPPLLERLPIAFKAALVLALALFVVMVVLLRKRSLYGLGMSFFVANVVLVLDYPSLGNLLLTDRFAYVGSLGLFIVVGSVVETVRERVRYGNGIGVLMMAAYIMFLGFQTISRCRTWRNDKILFSDAIEKYPVNPVAWTRLGCYFTEVGESDKALQAFDTAIEQSPHNPAVYAYRGRLRGSVLRDFDGALEDYFLALKQDRGNHVVLGDIGVTYSIIGKPDLALLYYDKALAAAPSYVNSYVNKGVLLLKLHRESEARLSFEKARSLGYEIPDEIATRLNIGPGAR